MQAQAAVTRRWLETVLVHDHGYRPHNVSQALQGLRATHPAIRRVRHRFEGETALTDVYAYGREPYDAELGYLGDLAVIRRAIFNDCLPGSNTSLVGDAGERFVRSALYQSKAWHTITQSNRRGSEALDLFASHRSGATVGFEVKNLGETIYPACKSFERIARKLKADAGASGVHPALVVAFGSDGLRGICRKLGISLVVLGAQVLPASLPDGRNVRKLIDRIRPIVGVTPYIFANTRFDAKRDSGFVELFNIDIIDTEEPRRSARISA